MARVDISYSVKQPKPIPEQKVSDEDMIKDYLKTNKVTVCPSVESIYSVEKASVKLSQDGFKV